MKKVVAASSASIYGLADTFPTREDHHPYNNRTWYGASKIMLEGLLRSYHDMYGLPYVALRYFNVYGPRMDIHGKYTEVLIRWMERIAAGQPPLILGDGQQTMDFVYIDDVARVERAGAGVRRRATRSSTSPAAPRPACDELAAALLRVMGAERSRPSTARSAAVNPVSRRLADTEQGRAPARLQAPRSAWRKACAGWSPGGRRQPGRGCRHDPDHQARDGRAARPTRRAASS